MSCNVEYIAFSSQGIRRSISPQKAADFSSDNDCQNDIFTVCSIGL